MNWASWNDFVAMGGYGLYVWGSYGVTLGMMVTEIVLLMAGKRSLLEQLRRTLGARGVTQ
jgi:heme exporter protein D